MSETIPVPEMGACVLADGDRDETDPEDGLAIVLDVADEPAGEYHIDALDQTVAEYNDVDEVMPVVVVAFVSGLDATAGKRWRAKYDASPGFVEWFREYLAEWGIGGLREYPYPVSRLSTARPPADTPAATGNRGLGGDR